MLVASIVVDVWDKPGDDVLDVTRGVGDPGTAVCTTCAGVGAIHAPKPVAVVDLAAPPSVPG